ncbi:MAG: carboxymuconolactone decarboxylase family protein, partial [Thermoplasmata archaeon]|nr:carboxymuconolactone decarboxylase family protein [Thermoplasmata archaeon]
MGKLPSAFEQFRKDYPDVFAAYEQVGGATLRAGPLDGKTRELVKLAISIGAGMEGAAHSHARRARDQGATPEEMRHVALLGLT